MYPDGQEVSNAMAVYLDQSLVNLQGLDNNVVTRLGSLARRFAPRWLYSAVTKAYVSRMLAWQQSCSCPLVTVSDIIAQEVGDALLLFICTAHACPAPSESAKCKSAESLSRTHARPMAERAVCDLCRASTPWTC